MINLIEEIEKEQLKSRPKIKAGDIVEVHQEIEEGGPSKAEAGKKRMQIFKGIVIKVRGKGSKKTITVRRISLGVGVERIYPIHLPSITKIKILKSTKVRRAKLYYLRAKKGKAAKLKEQAVSDEVLKFLVDQEKEKKAAQEKSKSENNDKADKAEIKEGGDKGDKSAKTEEAKKEKSEAKEETKTQDKQTPKDSKSKS